MFSDVQLSRYYKDETTIIRAKGTLAVLKHWCSLAENRSGLIHTIDYRGSAIESITIRVVAGSVHTTLQDFAAAASEHDDVDLISVVHGAAPRPQPTEPISVIYSTGDGWIGHDRNPAFESVGDAVKEMYSHSCNSAVTAAAVVSRQYVLRQRIRPSGINQLLRPRSVVVRDTEYA